MRTDIPEFRWPCILPNSILRGKFSEDQLAIVSWPTMEKIMPANVANRTGVEGNPARQPTRATQNAISHTSNRAVTRFLATRISLKPAGDVK